ncbi:MAG: hypothetical protein IMZ52_06865 [Actinobacteria bacterium]|nr:hypothetical protein [Actinomycetota bacterium]MBE3114594.1 hypothetical protein [Actinomycetota bacterium]
MKEYWRYCPKCQCIYSLEMFYGIHVFSGYCRDCMKEYQKNNISCSESRKKYLIEWYKENPNYLVEWYRKNPNYRKEWYNNHKEQCSKVHSKYMKTRKGKLANHRMACKHLGRGAILVLDNIFQDDIDMEYHHIFCDMPFIIPIPSGVHRKVAGSNGIKHFEYCKHWIKDIYGLDIDIFIQ